MLGGRLRFRVRLRFTFRVSDRIIVCFRVRIMVTVGVVLQLPGYF